MAECIATGCTKQVRTGARCPMCRAEHLFEATEFDDDLEADAEDDWVVVQNGVGGEAATGQTTLSGGIDKEESRRC